LIHRVRRPAAVIAHEALCDADSRPEQNRIRGQERVDSVFQFREHFREVIFHFEVILLGQTVRDSFVQRRLCRADGVKGRPASIVIVSCVNGDAFVIVGIWRIEEARKEPFGLLSIARKSWRGGMFNDWILIAKKGCRPVFAAPMGVVAPLVIVESDKRTDERGQRLMLRRRRHDQVAAMANSAFISG
jgi:hypothetical protein